MIGLSILRGELKPGDSLPDEDDLRAGSSVSRTALREAVRVLAAKGLVQARPKTGTRVRPRAEWNIVDPDVLAWRVEAGPDSELYKEVTEVRLGLEPHAARLAAARASDEEIAAIREAYAGMEAGVKDQTAYLVADLQFHDRILAGCHNELLGHLGSVLRAVFRTTFEFTTAPSTSRRRALPLHRAILEGIEHRNGDEAEEAMRTLIADTAADISRSAKRRSRAEPASRF
jgi:GntR family galactonate operon transcriptional repressor